MAGRETNAEERTNCGGILGWQKLQTQKGCISPVKQNRCSYPTSKTQSSWVTEKLAAPRMAAENWPRTSKPNASEILEDSWQQHAKTLLEVLGG